MNQTVRNHVGYKLTPGIYIKISRKSICIHAYIKKEIVEITRGMLDYLWMLSQEQSEKTLEEWLKQTEKKYGVSIEKEKEDEPLPNLKCQKKELKDLYLIVTAVEKTTKGKA